MNKEKIAFIPRQYLAVIAVLLAIMMSVLDGTIMNIALPTLAHDFDVTPSTAIWIVNAYQLVITMTLLSFASLGDIYGYRRIFLIGISIFVGASLACTLSTSFWMLTAARVIQGFGAACVMSVNTALIRLIYPPQILGRGMGVNAMVVAVSAAAGPSIAGSILALGSWHWLFVINIPLGLAALVIGHRLLPHNPPAEKQHKFDKISAIANALTFGLLIYSLEGFAHSENRDFIGLQIALLAIIGTFFIPMRVENVFSLIFVSIGNAVSPYVSQNLGAKKMDRIKKGYHAALVLDLCFAVLAFVVIETLHTQISSLFLGKDGSALAYQVSGDYMRWLGYFFIFMGIKMATDGVLRGLGIMRPFLIANMVNLAIRLAVALIFAPRFGIAFVWLAVPAGWFANFLISYVALNGCKVFSP